jgi:hypothetical protein
VIHPGVPGEKRSPPKSAIAPWAKNSTNKAKKVRLEWKRNASNIPPITAQ